MAELSRTERSWGIQASCTGKVSVLNNGPLPRVRTSLLASYADALWARHAIFLPHERLLKRAGTFLTLCSKRSAGEHVEITKQPIGAWLLFNRNPQRVIKLSLVSYYLWKTDSKSLLHVWKKLRENRRKQLFSRQFSVNPSGENKSVWQGFSGYRTLD